MSLFPDFLNWALLYFLYNVRLMRGRRGKERQEEGRGKREGDVGEGVAEKDGNLNLITCPTTSFLLPPPPPLSGSRDQCSLPGPPCLIGGLIEHQNCSYLQLVFYVYSSNSITL